MLDEELHQVNKLNEMMKMQIHSVLGGNAESNPVKKPHAHCTVLLFCGASLLTFIKQRQRQQSLRS